MPELSRIRALSEIEEQVFKTVDREIAYEKERLIKQAVADFESSIRKVILGAVIDVTNYYRVERCEKDLRITVKLER